MAGLDRRSALSALACADSAVGTDHRWERLESSSMLLLGMFWLVKYVEHGRHADFLVQGTVVWDTRLWIFAQHAL